MSIENVILQNLQKINLQSNEKINLNRNYNYNVVESEPDKLYSCRQNPEYKIKNNISYNG